MRECGCRKVSIPAGVDGSHFWIVGRVALHGEQALFSATFPRTVETLAKKVLHMPLEIIVGGRSVASSDITQHVEIRDDDDKFMRLLQVKSSEKIREDELVVDGAIPTPPSFSSALPHCRVELLMSLLPRKSLSRPCLRDDTANHIGSCVGSHPVVRLSSPC